MTDDEKREFLLVAAAAREALKAAADSLGQVSCEGDGPYLSPDDLQLVVDAHNQVQKGERRVALLLLSGQDLDPGPGRRGGSDGGRDRDRDDD